MIGFRVFKREGRTQLPTKASFEGYAEARKFARAWAAEQLREGYTTGQIVVQGPLAFGEEVIWLTSPPAPTWKRPVQAHAAKKRKSPKQLEREIAEALTQRPPRNQRRDRPRNQRRDRSHATAKASSTGGRWIHRTVAASHGVPEQAVRQIYTAVQTAKKQGLHGGYLADLIERSVGRKLAAGEYVVASKAREHLGYDPPGGYGGPKPTGSARESPRAMADDPKIERASRLVGQANVVIKDILDRRRDRTFNWDESNDSSDRALLRQAADELDVAADLYEGGGGPVRAGTLRQRATYARQGNYKMLDAYGA